MRNFLMGAAVLIASLCSSAGAGWFEVTDEDSASVSARYIGTVDPLDIIRWEMLSSHAGNRVILLTIDSPGGHAYAGLELYWRMEAHPRLVTIAGSEVGAWSAAAIIWTAGDHRLIAQNGAVWFHAAFCTWDPEPPVHIGCDTTNFQSHHRILHYRERGQGDFEN